MCDDYQLAGVGDSHTKNDCTTTALPPLSSCGGEWWWQCRDQNRNRIDDLIEERISIASNSNNDHRIDIFVDYTHRPQPADIARLAALDLDIVYVAKYINTVQVSNVRVTDIQRIIELPNVRMVELCPELLPDLSVSVPAVRARNSGEYSPETAWELGYTGNGIGIAILDSGVDDLLHESLQGKFVAGADFSGTVYLMNVNPTDNLGHGTYCASVALGDGGSTQKYMGIAPNASLIDIKVYNAGVGSPNGLIAGLEWCIDNKDEYNIRVASISLSYEGNTDGQDAISQAANAAVDAGIVVVAAMGNDGAHRVPTPAAGDKVIAVGAINDRDTVMRDDDEIANFSNYGPRTADNDDDYYDELKPELVAPGDGIVAAKSNTHGTYIEASGTSAATPHVAGLVALMAEANPKLQPEAFVRILQDTAEHRGDVYAPALDTKYNAKYGWGIIDAYGAVSRAQDLTTGTIIAPDEVIETTELELVAGIEFTRTEYTITTDSVHYKLVVPAEWGIPQYIVVDDGDSEDAIDATTTHTTPVLTTDGWVFDAWVNYTGTTNDCIELYPTVTFSTIAPALDPDVTAANYTFQTLYWINGVEGKPATKQVTVIKSPAQEGEPDLAINANDITFSTNTPTEGDEVIIYAEVRNIGEVDVPATTVDFYDIDTTGNVAFIGTDTIAVAANSSATATATWVAVAGTHEIRVLVDPANNIDESNELNNNASKLIYVSSDAGANFPPTAVLEVSTERAAIGDIITFDGSDSVDPDGEIVVYSFEFGDGTSYVETVSYYPDGAFDGITTHAYVREGDYTAKLNVTDDRSEPSINTATAAITIVPINSRKYYFYPAFKLDETLPPTDGDPYVEECPNGFVPGPGGIGGIVEWKEVGEWSHPAIPGTIELKDTVTFHVWLQNRGEENISNIRLEFTLNLNGEPVTTPTTEILVNLTVGGEPKELVVTVDMDEATEVKYLSNLSVYIRCKVNGDGVVLLYGTATYDSGVKVFYSVPANKYPIADAGDDQVVTVNTTVYFVGDAKDLDGTIIKYEWDCDGDGIFEWSSTSSSTATYVYNAIGTYVATFRVTDDDGAFGVDICNVTVNPLPVNQLPIVAITNPIEGANVSGKTEINGTAHDPDGIIKKVEVSFDGPDNKWVSATLSDTTTWYYIWDTTLVSNGNHTISARALDNNNTYSPIVTISIVVFNLNYPPYIRTAFVTPSQVYNDGSKVTIIATVVDDNGLDDIDFVHVDLSEIGKSSIQPMFDDGTHGDAVANDGNFSYELTIGAQVKQGTKIFVVTACDHAGETATTAIKLTVVQTNYPPKIKTLRATPKVVLNDGKSATLIEVEVTDPNELVDIKEVTINLTAIGKDARAVMRDDGIGDDVIAGDGWYSLKVTILADTPPGIKELEVTVTDLAGATATGNVTIEIREAAPPSDEVPPKPTEPGWFIPGGFAVAILILVLLIVVVGIIVVRKSKRGKS
jgi:hypothetical protein